MAHWHKLQSLCICFVLLSMRLRPSFSMDCFVGSQAIIKRASVNESSGKIVQISTVQTVNQFKIEQCPYENCACCSYFYNVSESQYCVSWSAENLQGCELQTPKISEPVYALKATSCDTPQCNECFGLQSSATQTALPLVAIALTFAIQFFGG